MRGVLIAVALIGVELIASPGAAKAACQTTTFEAIAFTYCTAEAGDDLRLFLNGADGLPYGGFGAVDASLAATGQHLAFAMNAGMLSRINRRSGYISKPGLSGTRSSPPMGRAISGCCRTGCFVWATAWRWWKAAVLPLTPSSAAMPPNRGRCW